MGRILAYVSLVAVLGLGLLGYVAAEEPKAGVSNAAVARIAHRLLGAEGADLDRAIARTEALDTKVLRSLILEMRDQIRIRAVLAKKRVRALQWEDVNLDGVVTYLRTITGETFLITPKARSEQFASILVTLHFDDVAVGSVLDIVTEPYGLKWVPQNGVVRIMTPEEYADDLEEGSDADARMLRAKIKATTVDLSVQDQSFREVVKIVQLQTGINIHIDPRAEDEIGMTVINGLLVEDIPLSTLLDMLQSAAGEQIIWTTRGNVVLFTRRDLLEK